MASTRRYGQRGFTIVELMAVVLVILLIAGLTLGVAKYVLTRVKVVQTKAQIAALEAAIERFQSDNGYYPTTTVYRLSTLGYSTKENSYMLYQAVKKYMTFSSSQLKYDSGNFTNIGVNISDVTYIVDAWGYPIVYYNPATNIASETSYTRNVNLTTSNTVNLSETDYCTIGGKVNGASYDLFSYGPDTATYIINSAEVLYSSPSSANDDIWSSK